MKLNERAQTYLDYLNSPGGFEDWDTYAILADLLEEEGIPLFTTVRWMAVNQKRPDHWAFNGGDRNWNLYTSGEMFPSYLASQIYCGLKNKDKDATLVECIEDLHFALNGEQ